MSKVGNVFVTDEEIASEFQRSTERFHVIACWIGIVLNLVWFISDYFVLPNYWLIFIEWRAAVSAVALVVLLFRKKISLSIYHCLFILVLGISIQNSYMWSVMDAEHMKQHTFAYIALFIGAGMLVLWEFYYSVILMVLTLIFNFLFFYLNQTSISFGEFMIDGAMLTFSVGVFCMFLIRSRYRLTLTEIKNRLGLARSKEIIEKEHAVVIEQKLKIETQKNLLEEFNKEVTDSINYAKRIQSALIPTEDEFLKYFKESFVFFKPKDIVSGDFYWIKEVDNKIFYATADCTGHGVPGGFMTMLGLSFLDEIVKVQEIYEPELILNRLREKIIDTLKQTGQVGENKDGMDIVICVYDVSSKKFSFSGANNSLYQINPDSDDLLEFKPDKQPCGFYHAAKPFTKVDIQVAKGSIFYSFTDGYADQFGGPKGKKFKYRQLEEILNTNKHLPFSQQKQILKDSIYAWMTNRYPQTDDMLIVGVKIDQ
ncbi:MAG: PP2C family protein-serine/threonine phosphatase [Bacteroidota bacterium]|jgi:sigma-B regulation protein RsbU (phosphoserine phosphatase)